MSSSRWKASFPLIKRSFSQGGTDFINAKIHYEQKKYEKAFSLFKQLAEQDNKEAQFYLYLIYANGEGIVKDEQKATYWLTKAAEQGHAKAQTSLGLHYAFKFQSGLKNHRNYDAEQAEFWFRKAAYQGDSSVQFYLGNMYCLDYSFCGRKVDEAEYWLLKAGEQGHSDAQYNLGLMYFDGSNVESKYLYEPKISYDFLKAVQWLTKAAEQDHTKAQYKLGFLYRYGKGVHKNYNLAEYWFQKSANQGDTDAAVELSKRKLWWFK